jgi:hypothetical protein
MSRYRVLEFDEDGTEEWVVSSVPDQDIFSEAENYARDIENINGRTSMVISLKTGDPLSLFGSLSYLRTWMGKY